MLERPLDLKAVYSEPAETLHSTDMRLQRLQAANWSDEQARQLGPYARGDGGDDDAGFIDNGNDDNADGGDDGGDDHGRKNNSNSKSNNSARRATAAGKSPFIFIWFIC